MSQLFSVQDILTLLDPNGGDLLDRADSVVLLSPYQPYLPYQPYSN